MSQTLINPTARVASPNSATLPNGAEMPQQTLGQDDFLKLLIAQLSAQDPMNPVKDTEFVGQMATFSSLQQTQSMQKNLANLQANSLLGRVVQVSAGQGETTSGVVSAITMEAGTPYLIINGQRYELSQVQGVAPATN
jgi:flagellar basal-body rod modification protein FlgD